MSRVHVTTQVFLAPRVVVAVVAVSLFHPRCKWKTENISCFHLKAALTPHQPGRKARKCKEMFEASCDIFMGFSERLSSFLNPVHASTCTVPTMNTTRFRFASGGSHNGNLLYPSCWLPASTFTEEIVKKGNAFN